MARNMATRILKIGNSQGLTIPQPLREQTPRQDWEEQFRQMAEYGDDALLDDAPLTLTEWEAHEWEW